MPRKINLLGVALSIAIFIINSWLVFIFLNLRETNYIAIVYGLGFFYLLALFVFVTSIKGESLKDVFFKKDVSGHFGTKKGEKLPFGGKNLYRNFAYTIIFAILIVIFISTINSKGYIHNLLWPQ